MEGKVLIGVSGWRYTPWRGHFYPKGLAQWRELQHASRVFPSLELNGSFYSLQHPASYAMWAEHTPEDFVFAVKGSRYITHMLKLRNIDAALANFFASGLFELGDKLGPILWQLMATKRFDPDDIKAFLALLPRSLDGIPLQHVLEPRHESFRDPAFVALCREAGVAIVFGDGADFPLVPDITGPIVYARFMRAKAELEQGYEPAELDRLAETAKAWSRGESPAGFPYVAEPAPVQPRDVYLFFISAAKERNPAAAMSLIGRL